MDDITFNPGQTDAFSQELQRQELTRERTVDQLAQQSMQMNAAQGVRCPYCGAINEPDAMFCASCGQPMGMVTCPNCGAEVDPDADFCETCHHYIKSDTCSFCGCHLTGQEAYCPECGSPRGGIVCPVCHTLNDFSFCKQCGTPLTEEAHRLMGELQMTPEYKEMQQISLQLQQLEMELPFATERDVVRDQLNQKLRERVLSLLAKDKGIASPIVARPAKRMDKKAYEERRQAGIDRLTELLDNMAQRPQPQPAKVRNYAMACKPQGVRLAWECNFKHALHSSPCGCAKPQLGGKWVILGNNSKQDIKDDE